MILSRRHLIQCAAAGAVAGGWAIAAAAEGQPAGAPGRRRRLLVRSSWQSVNIGDIGHTPGLLRLLETHLPDVDVTLWPVNVEHGVDDMLQRAFPRVRIAKGRLDADGRPATPELRQAFESADMLVHGSGPSVVCQKDLESWRRTTGKPYGVYGVTVGAVDDGLRDLLSGARFVFCRDTISLGLIREKGVQCSVMEFAPDATFAIHLRDEERAAAYLRAAGLEEGEFVCAIPRLRYTPYYQIHHREPTAEDLRKDAVNEQHKEADHAKLRHAMVEWVRKTGLKVLACPEMTHEVQVAKEMLVDPLPADVKANVVWRDTYWRPDEAGSVYARALAVVSFEMHSPIIAAAMGTPAFHLRQPEDTCKGQMWRDIGLSDWIFEIETARGEEIAERLLQVQADVPAARAKMAKAMEFVGRRQKETIAAVGRALAA